MPPKPTRRLFLKTLATATASFPAAGFSAKADANDWEITRIPLSWQGCPAIFAEKDTLWATHPGGPVLYKTADSEKWQNYADHLPGTPYCLYVVPDEEKEPRNRTVYVGVKGRRSDVSAILRLKPNWVPFDTPASFPAGLPRKGKLRELEMEFWTEVINPPTRLTSLLLTEDENGSPTLFAADAGQRNVLRYDAEGKFMHRLYEDGELIVPSPYLAMCVGRDGLLRVVNPGKHRVEAFHVREKSTPQEKSLTWGTESKTPEGFAGCCNPAWLAVTESGNFFTSEKRFLRLKLHDPEGNFLEEVPLPPKEKNVVTEGYPVAAEGENLYVLDTNANVVYRYTKK